MRQLFLPSKVKKQQLNLKFAIETHKLLYSYQFPLIARAYIWPIDSFWVSMEEKKREVTDPVRNYLGSKSNKIAEKHIF